MLQATLETLEFLVPWDLDGIEKIRVGNRAGDGGYVMANRFRYNQKVYSFGISTEVSFDLDLARRGLSIFMFDHTIDKPPVDHQNFHFDRLGIADVRNTEATVMSLADHLARLGHLDDDDMILKMDVEGWEWPVLEAVDLTILRRFEQIVLELHDLHKLGEERLGARVRTSLEKLTATHTVFHVHANNAVPISLISGVPIPPLLEVSLIRKDLAKRVPSRTVYPTILDAPNVGGRLDHLLAFFPFLPNAIAPTDLGAGLIAAAAHVMSTAPREVNPAAQVSTRGRNIALGRDAKQSSLSSWSRGADDACGAVNGMKNGGFGFHTDFERNPWWEVDLGSDAIFDEIIVYNRINGCSDRARSICALVSQDGSCWQLIYEHVGSIFGGADGDPLRIACPRTNARWVRLLLRDLTAFHLDEVEIYDYEAVT